MNVLYLTYDGMLDPLGDSQILPYIEGVRSEVNSFYLISFEKKSKKACEIKAKKTYLSNINITWIPLSFSQSSNIFFKVLDMLKLYFAIFKVLNSMEINLIHARGHPCASAALLFKTVFNFKLLFDFRGLWADEKVTKGGWNLSNKLHFLQYKYYKNRERKLFNRSEKIVVLTKNVASEIERLCPGVSTKILIIPCAADYNHFKLSQNKHINSQGGINHLGKITFGYLGSIGPMYQFQKYLRLIDLARKQGIDANGLIVTGNVDLAEKEVNSYFHIKNPKFLEITSAKRSEIPELINQMDCLISFYAIKYSVISVSPTKIGETLACGVPIICNSGIGDTDNIIKSLDAGMIIDDTSDVNLQKVIAKINKILNSDPSLIREKSKEVFDLNIAVAKYINLYNS
ncbi:glycosyltransferase [Gammaproteobacteria bacterium]|jgi:glycosyltransferase involved in cell wall biosynthesis|nr:glycosyltransferase [Gammaproteobacteria bacterium]MDC0129009.1 glycosyltransferase [Gammaproteobacteria bacterium]